MVSNFVLMLFIPVLIVGLLSFFRYERSASGGLEENHALYLTQCIAIIIVCIGVIGCAWAIFNGEITQMYRDLLKLNPQADFLNQIFAALTCIVIGVLHALISYLFVQWVAMSYGNYLLQVITPPLSSQNPPAHGERVANADDIPVYGCVPPTLIELADHAEGEGILFRMQSADLVAAMKDAGWKLQRDPELRTSTPQ